MFTFFGVCQGIPEKEFNIKVSFIFDPAVVKEKQYLNITCNPSKDILKKGIRQMKNFEMSKNIIHGLIFQVI